MAVLASWSGPRWPRKNPILNMTGLGMNRWETVDMDLIEVARTIHQDRLRQIEQETHRRRLLDLRPASSATTSSGQSDATSRRAGQSLPTASSAR